MGTGCHIFASTVVGWSSRLASLLLWEGGYSQSVGVKGMVWSSHILIYTGKEAKTGLLGYVLYRSYGSSVPRRAIGYYHDSGTC